MALLDLQGMDLSQGTVLSAGSSASTGGCGISCISLLLCFTDVDSSED